MRFLGSWVACLDLLPEGCRTTHRALVGQPAGKAVRGQVGLKEASLSDVVLVASSLLSRSTSVRVLEAFRLSWRYLTSGWNRLTSNVENLLHRCGAKFSRAFALSAIRVSPLLFVQSHCSRKSFGKLGNLMVRQVSVVFNDAYVGVQ